jgi:hypothetical protein
MLISRYIQTGCSSCGPQKRLLETLAYQGCFDKRTARVWHTVEEQTAPWALVHTCCNERIGSHAALHDSPGFVVVFVGRNLRPCQHIAKISHCKNHIDQSIWKRLQSVQPRLLLRCQLLSIPPPPAWQLPLHERDEMLVATC